MSLRVIVADSDVRFGELLVETLDSQGLEALLASGPSELVSAIRRAAPELLLIDVDLEGGVVDLLPGLSLPSGAMVVWMGRRGVEDPVVQEALASQWALSFLQKPFSLLDFGDRLRAIAASAGSGAVRSRPLPPAGVRSAARAFQPRGFDATDSHHTDPRGLVAGRHASPLARLSRLWASRATGVIRVQRPAPHLPQRIPIAEGAPFDVEGRLTLLSVLDDGDLIFEQRPLGGRGDWPAMGAALLSVAREGAARGFAERRHAAILHRTARTPAAESLSLGRSVIAVLQRADGQQTLASLVAGAGLALGDLDPDLAAVASMGLLLFRPPREIRGKAVDPGRARLPPQDTGSSASEITSFAHHSGAGPNRPLGSGHRRVGAALQQSVRVVGQGQVPTQDPKWLVTWLERELRHLREASPFTVLMVPEDASPEVVKEAFARFARRYEQIVANPGCPPAAQRLARELSAIGQRAVELVQRQSQVTLERPALQVEDEDADPEIQALLRRGRGLIEAADWQAADEILSRAQDLRLDHPLVLSLLGWARWNNEALPQEERQADGRDLLLLAEQFDPQLPDCQLYLARILSQGDDLPAAIRRATRAVKLTRSSKAAMDLLHELKARQDPSI